MDDHAAGAGDRIAGGGAPSFGSYGGSAPENYERYFVPAIAAPLAARLIETAAPTPGERVLDVACGTGVVARLAAERVGAGGAVTGQDANPGMLAVARSVPASGAAIEWRESDAADTGLPESAYEVALCQMGLQFFADRAAALREVRRALAPGGRLVANVPGPTPPLFGILEEALHDRVSPQAARFVAAVFSLHEAAELEGLLGEAGFGEVSVRRRSESLMLPPPADFLWQYVWSTPLASVLSEVEEADRRSLEREVIAGWQDFADDGQLILDVDVVEVTALEA